MKISWVFVRYWYRYVAVPGLIELKLLCRSAETVMMKGENKRYKESKYTRS